MTWNLARALVAAWLNVSSGNDASCITATIDHVTAWLVDHRLGGGIPGSDPTWAEASGWAAQLDEYNNGLLCAEHRDAGGPDQEATTTRTTSQKATHANEPGPAIDSSSQQAGDRSGPASPNGKGKAKGRR